jgi:hypothetical protein
MYFWAWRHATRECLRIVEAWGFRKASSLYWIKTRPDGSLGYLSTGYYGMADPVEELWVCQRGNYVAPMMGDGFARSALKLLLPLVFQATPCRPAGSSVSEQARLNSTTPDRRRSAYPF